LIVAVYYDEIATLAADNAAMPIGRLTGSAARFEVCRGGHHADRRPPTRQRSVTGAII